MKSFRVILTYEKLIGISIFNAKETIWKKMYIFFYVDFCLDIYNFSIDTFWTYLVYDILGSAHCVGNGHRDLRSNPGWVCLDFT